MIARAVAFACMLAVCAAARADTADGYAYRIPLAVAGDGAFVHVALPAVVYEGVVRADLGDLRVFNADGAPVAHAFVPLATPREAAGSAALPLFPLRVDAARPDLADVAITVRSGAQGPTIDLATRAGEPVAAQRLAGYLADATGVAQPIFALTLPFARATNVTTRVRIDASDDLAAWRTLAADTPLIDVESGGRRLVRNRVEFAPTAARYLRLTWPAGEPAPELASVTADYGKRVAETAREWRSVASLGADKPGEYAFDIGGMFPVDRVTLELAQLNTVAPAQLDARAASSAEWQPVASGVFYRLQRTGGDVTNPPLAIAPLAHRQWRVRVDPKTPTSGGDVRLSVGWRPHVVVFAARGSGPFTLAYGSRAAQPSALAIATLVPGYDPVTFDPSTLARATPGSPTVADTRALREPLDVKRWALWSALVAASIVLGAMALRLQRRIGDRAERLPEDGSDASGERRQ
jgi:hypothetical protein